MIATSCRNNAENTAVCTPNIILWVNPHTLHIRATFCHMKRQCSLQFFQLAAGTIYVYWFSIQLTSSNAVQIHLFIPFIHVVKNELLNGHSVSRCKMKSAMWNWTSVFYSLILGRFGFWHILWNTKFDETFVFLKMFINYS